MFALVKNVLAPLALASLTALAHCKQSPAPASGSATTASRPTADPSANSQPVAAIDAGVAAPVVAASSAPVSGMIGQSVDRTQWEARCKANQSCPAIPAIAQCAAGAQARAFDAAYNDRHALVGQRVSVRGHVVASAGCTEMACPERSCCNGCFGTVVLVASNTRGAGMRSFSFVGGEPSDGPFACRGDDSAVCCGMAADGRELVATGTIELRNGRYILSNPEFCAP
ncbi:MAG: hypothetical protein U0269_13890 [Polyangiales bacterium]